jgi:DNA-binding NarL/FixJ family response regulator
MSKIETILIVSKSFSLVLIIFSPIVREGLHTNLAKDRSITLIGTSGDGTETLPYIKRLSNQRQLVNVVLTETRSGAVDEVQVTRRIKVEFPEVAVLVLTENLNDTYIIDAIHAGAGGYIFLHEVSPHTKTRGLRLASTVTDSFDDRLFQKEYPDGLPELCR